MPMERKRPRELSERFRYKFVERFDVKNNVLKIPAFCANFLVIGMRQRRIFLPLVGRRCFAPLLGKGSVRCSAEKPILVLPRDSIVFDIFRL